MPQHTGEVISPAEMKTWQEWAQKTPALIRSEVGAAVGPMIRKLEIGTVLGIVTGVALTAASFTKHVPGKWKWLTGAGAMASGGASYVAGVMAGATRQNIATYHAYAGALEKDPALNRQLADYLSKHVTADDIQQRGIEASVLMHSMAFGMETPHLQNHAATIAALSHAGAPCIPCR